MKVYGNGATHWSSQLPRILDGFRQLGHEVTDLISAADLVYSQNDHAQIVRDCAAGVLKPGAKVIFTQLDIPEHILSQFDLAACRTELAAADAVCTISRFGQWQLQHYLELSSTVIYNPIKPVIRIDGYERQTPYRYLSAARRSDPNKRASVWTAALQMLGVAPREVAIVGNEPWWGDYQGVQSDESLNRFYNEADFVMTLGRIEGLSLGTLEAMAAGSIPIVASDMSTRSEILPRDLFPEYDNVAPSPSSVATFIARYLHNPAAMEDLKTRLYDYFLAHWADRVSPIGVARAILSVYDTLS